MPQINKKELEKLPIYQLTCSQHAWLYPEQTCHDHFKAVRDAVRRGWKVYSKVFSEYPGLEKERKDGKNVAQR